MSERKVQNDIRLAVGGDVTLFRNNVGKAWAGEAVTLKDGSVLIRNPRPFHAGLMKGSADLIGWRSIIVTPEMVGQKLAVFASVEVKSAKGRATLEQKTWHANVINAGGLSVIAHSAEEAKKGLALNGK